MGVLSMESLKIIITILTEGWSTFCYHHAQAVLINVGDQITLPENSFIALHSE